MDRVVHLNRTRGPAGHTTAECSYLPDLWDWTERFGVGFKVLYSIRVCRRGAGDILAKRKCAEQRFREHWDWKQIFIWEFDLASVCSGCYAISYEEDFPSS